MAPNEGQDGFLIFLPSDNDDLGSPSTQAALTLITDDLGHLLQQPAAAFWDTVKRDKSLSSCLDSFLRFRRRSFDGSSVQALDGASVLQQLSRRVFMAYLRLVTPGEAGGLPPAQHADLLYTRRLVDVPRLMDLCVLYGGANRRLTQRLVAAAFELQPRYREDVAALAGPLVNNLQQLLSSCTQLAGKVCRGAADLAKELAEAARYIQDACLTLRAFVEVHPPAAALLLLEGLGALPHALAALHDQLLPLLARAGEAAGAGAAPTAALEPLAAAGLERLRGCLLAAVWQLLLQAFCTAEGAGAGAASLGAEVQGEQLLTLLMALPGPGEAGGAEPQSLLQRLNQRHHLDASIAVALQQGLLALDSAQGDYLMALLGGDPSLLSNGLTGAGRPPSAPAPDAGAGPSGSGANGSGAALPPGGVEAAVLASQISQIREVLPDYGDGFLTAALHGSGYSAEAVLNTLLEGGAPAGTHGLDPKLQSWAPPQAAPAPARGKGPVIAAAAAAPPSGELSWAGLAADARAASSSATAARPPAGPALTAAPARRQAERRTARVLGAVGSDLRQVTHALAGELQFEYDDEYDDSFDDLVGPGTDGVCEAEEGQQRGRDGGRGATPSQQGQPPLGSGLQQRPPTPEQQPLAGGAGPSGAAAGAGRGRARPPVKERRWVLEGRVYNYPKPGAQEVVGEQGVEQALQAAEHAAMEIHGLGPGGNVPLGAQEYGDGGGRGGGGRGGGRGRGASFDYKDRHKAAIGNHHRKDRALRKQGGFL